MQTTYKVNLRDAVSGAESTVPLYIVPTIADRDALNVTADTALCIAIVGTDGQMSINTWNINAWTEFPLGSITYNIENIYYIINQLYGITSGNALVQVLPVITQTLSDGDNVVPLLAYYMVKDVNVLTSDGKNIETWEWERKNGLNPCDEITINITGAEYIDAQIYVEFYEPAP